MTVTSMSRAVTSTPSPTLAASGSSLWGWVVAIVLLLLLSAIAWSWAGYALWTMNLDFLMPFQKFIPVAVLVCIPLTWFWLDNLLPCRAIGGILTLFPYGLLHAARVHPSPWRLVLVTLAYLCIVKGMILLLYPWKMRQAIVWITQRPTLFRLAGILDTLLGLFLIGLGATVLR